MFPLTTGTAQTANEHAVNNAITVRFLIFPPSVVHTSCIWPNIFVQYVLFLLILAFYHFYIATINSFYRLYFTHFA